MKEVLSRFGKLEANHYRLIILFQFLIIAAFTINLAANPRVNLNTKALGNSFSEAIQNDVKTCLSLPQDQREMCAKLTGAKIAIEISDPTEQIKACLLFRPHFFVYNCQEGLVSH